MSSKLACQSHARAIDKCDGVKTLSVRQPWASLIASGRKRIELRSWPTTHRGVLRIASGTQLWRGEHGYPTDGPRGVLLCEVVLVDVRPATPEDAAVACIVPPEGWYAWVFGSAMRQLEQRPVKGRLGLFET